MTSSHGEGRRQRSRRGGSRCSHSSSLDTPLLELGSNMTIQLAHERNGLLLSYLHSSTSDDASQILHALQRSDLDLSKAQPCGHCDDLIARLTESLLHYLLFAKGQLPEPVSLVRKRRDLASCSLTGSTRRRSGNPSARTMKEDKVLRKLDQLRSHLEQAAKQLAQFAKNNGEGPSRRPYESLHQSITANDLRLLVVMGASASMPQEVFVLDLIQAVGRCASTEDAVQRLLDSNASVADSRSRNDEDLHKHLFNFASDISAQHRSVARDKTSSNWERKLVRLLVSDERLDPFLGAPLAPTKMHIFLSAPTNFRCQGWTARPHLDFDLDRLCGPTSSTDTSISSIPLQRSSKTGCESCSSVAESWPQDSASDRPGESSVSSISEEDASRPSSAADKVWNTAGAEGWLPRCSSPLVANAQLSSIETSRTGSSLGSSTVYGHEAFGMEAESIQDVSQSSDHPIDVRSGSVTEASPTALPSASGMAARRRSREPKAGSLLSRNLLRGDRSRHNSYATSDSSSVRSVTSYLKRTPRCAGLQVDFSDPDSAAAELVSSEIAERKRDVLNRCWFQCEAVLEGFR